MAELNGLMKSALINHNKNEENKDMKLSMLYATDASYNSKEKTVSEDTTKQPIPKVAARSDSDRNILLPLLNIDAHPHRPPSVNPPQHLKTHTNEPESPTLIIEASDSFLDPALYDRYSICTDIEDTFHERLAKKIEVIKDVSRDKAVDGITAGENAILWLVNSFKYLTSGWLGLVILLVTIFIYCLGGAVMFMLLEGPYEEIYQIRLADVREALTDKIETIVKNETIMSSNPKLLTLLINDLISYENKYSEYIKSLQNNDVTKPAWTFWNSFMFAGTIFSTIGYGHIAARTSSGRVATIVYALIGIPLFLIVLTSFGKFLTRIIKFFWVHIMCYRKGFKFRKAPAQVENKSPNTEAVYRPSLIEDKIEESSLPHDEIKNETHPAPSTIGIDEELNLPTKLVLFILVLYMLCGALVAHILESWTFLDSFYYVFISMSTIGLGDFVISNPIYTMYFILYIIFGLSLTAMCIEVIQRNLTIVFKQACDKIEYLLQETEDGSRSIAN